MPDSYAQTPDGLLLVANGVDAMLVWDGLGDVAEAGLAPPLTALTLKGAGAGIITGTYYAYTRFVDKRGNYSNLSPLSAAVQVGAVSEFDYSNVPTPLEDKVVRRQILRNTDGQTAVFYVDVDTTDITSGTFSSQNTDAVLLTKEPQSLFDTSLSVLANTHDRPPAHKSVIAHHLDRMFAACEVEYRQGCVSCTPGSLSVTGVGTEWPSTFEGRFLWVDGAQESYQIDSVDVAGQVLTLLDAYAGPPNPYAVYAIRPAPAERRLVYYSLGGEPESWPVTQALELQEDGDELTGLMAKGSFIYFLERRHIYRFTFQSDPGTDGFVFLTSTRGCVNNRCWVDVDQNAYLLDEAGCYIFSGGQEVQSISAPIQDLFESEAQDSEYKINWSARSYFHASYHPGQQTIRWFVALSGQDFPRHALCFDIVGQRWWIEEYPVPIGASVLGRYLDEPRVFLGGPAGQVYLFGEGQLDRARPGGYTLRSTATGGSPATLGDSTATFASSMVGNAVVIVSGRGRGQRRIIAGVAGTTLRVSQPWLILPDATSVYQVGGVQWRYRTKLWRFHDDDREQPRRLEILYEPCTSATDLEVRAYVDRSGNPVVWGSTISASDYPGLSSVAGDEVLSGDLTRPLGYLQRRLDGFRDLYADGPRFLQLELGGVVNQDIVRLYQLVVDGVK